MIQPEQRRALVAVTGKRITGWYFRESDQDEALELSLSDGSTLTINAVSVASTGALWFTRESRSAAEGSLHSESVGGESVG